MKWIKFLIILFLLSSCGDTYYYITNAEDIYIYPSPSKNDYSKDITLIPAGTYYYSTVENKKYRKVKFGNQQGYIYNPYFDNPYYEPDTINKSKSGERVNQASSYSPQNYSSSSSSSNSSGSKTVHVKGYYRKDGTYVKPHTRSAPRRR